MKSTVKIVKTQIIFTFSNGKTYELPLAAPQGTSLNTYGTKVSLTEKLYTPSSSNIIGQISSNLLSITLTSKDKLLISNNESSPYFGYMNETAMIDIWCTAVDDNNTKTYMGRYWVSTWENGTSSSNKYEVNISAVNLLNKIKQISLVKVSLQRNISFKNYLITIINKLNSSLPATMKIKYNESDLDIFSTLDYPWEMYYNNIDRDNIEIIFNNIAQNSLSYIWIDRDNYLKVDCLIDDKETELVASFSGEQNIFSYELTNGDIYQYSGVKVNYIENVSYLDEEVLQMSRLTLQKGRNTITASLKSDKVINIYHIEIELVDNPTHKAICTSFFNYRDKIEMNIQSSIDTTNANIIVYGTTIEENKNSIIKYKSANDESSVLEIDNNILRKECIGSYVDGMIQLLSMKNGQLIIEGYINPAIRLDNIISMYGKSLNIDGYYKVIGLQYTLGTSYRCKATLIKTIDIVPDIESLLYDDKIAVLNMMAGSDMSGYKFKVLNNTQEQIVQSKLGANLNKLKAYL